MARVAFKQADVARLVRGVVEGGMPIGSFAIQILNGSPAVVPIDHPIQVGAKIEHGPSDEMDALKAIEELERRYG